MLFEGLNKIKRQSIMTAIMFLAAGMMLVIWPGDQVVTLLKTVSWLMLVWSMVMILEYIKSEKSIMDYIWLCVALGLGILGTWTAFFDVDLLGAIAWVAGILLVIDGLHSGIHAMIYSRRSGRKAWWILLILSIVMVALGVLTICHPWWPEPKDLLRAIGWMTIGAAVLSALRLIWVWPLKAE